MERDTRKEKEFLSKEELQKAFLLTSISLGIQEEILMELVLEARERRKEGKF